MTAPLLSLTRRHFLSTTSLGLGGVALASLLPGPAEAASGLHFPAKAKRVIYLFQSGGPAQQDLFDYKPLLNEKNGEQLPDHVRGGQRLTGMSVNQASIPLAGSALQVRPARPERRLAQRAAAAHRADRRRAVLRQIDVHRGDQPRPGHHLLPDRLANRRPAVAWAPGSATAWASMNAEPARVRRAGHEEQGRPAALCPALGQRLPRLAIPGRASSRRARTRSSTSPTPTASPPPAAATMLDTAGVPRTSVQVRARARPRDRVAHRPVRDGLPHADERAGGDRPLEGAAARPRPVRPRRRERPAPSRPTACWPAGWPSAACASSSSITRAGTITATCRRRFAAQARETDQPAPRSINDLKQRGMLDDTLVIWGGEFGRTSYSQGKLTKDRLRPRPPPALLHDLAGRRAASSPASPTARPTTTATTSPTTTASRSAPTRRRSRPGPSTSTTCRRRSCTCWASTTSG